MNRKPHGAQEIWKWHRYNLLSMSCPCQEFRSQHVGQAELELYVSLHRKVCSVNHKLASAVKSSYRAVKTTRLKSFRMRRHDIGRKDPGISKNRMPSSSRSNTPRSYNPWRRPEALSTPKFTHRLRCKQQTVNAVCRIIHTNILHGQNTEFLSSKPGGT